MARNYNKSKAAVDFQNRKDIWLNRMMRLASNAIRWKGLPDSIDKVYMELCLTRSGRAIIVHDDITGSWLNGQDASVGLLDIYGVPMERSIIYRNGRQQWYAPETSVIIYNNGLRCSDLWMYTVMAETLADLDCAIRINCNSQKTMPIIPVKEQQALSALNLYQDLIENIPFHLVDPQGLDIEAFKNAIQFDNRKSFTGDNLVKVQREFWNRCLTIIGINNANVEKAERSNIAEIDSNLDEIAIMRRDRINSRERAIQEMKRLWGWEVSVDYYSNIKVREEGNGNGSIYDASEDDM